MLILNGFLVSTPREINYGFYSAKASHCTDYTARFPFFVLFEILHGKASSILEPNTA
jgi:hypothetical protein